MIKGKSIKLSAGSSAEDMGCGVFILSQGSEHGPQSVVITLKDIRRLIFRG